MSDQAGECESALAGRRLIQRERQSPGSEEVAGLVGAGLVERRIEADHHAVPPQLELVRPNPASVRTQHLVVGRADQLAPIL